MILLLAGGIAFFLVGLLAIVFGFQIKEFSLGNTSMLGGAVAIGTGAILLGLHAAVRELAAIGRGMAVRVAPLAVKSQPPVEDLAPATSGQEGDFLFSRDQPGSAAGRAPERPHPPQPDRTAPPWQDAAGSRDRGRPREPLAAEPEPVVESKGRRNLLFSSSRKERAARLGEPAPETGSATEEPAPRSIFDQAWPERSRAEPALRRRQPPAADEPAADPEPAEPTGDDAAVTVLKSGVVDGMAYSLYSDGSIEAQMPEGLMRFASIEELRSHLDQRS